MVAAGGRGRERGFGRWSHLRFQPVHWPVLRALASMVATSVPSSVPVRLPVLVPSRVPVLMPSRVPSASNTRGHLDAAHGHGAGQDAVRGLGGVLGDDLRGGRREVLRGGLRGREREGVLVGVDDLLDRRLLFRP